MKITREQLKRIIKEEMSGISLQEIADPSDPKFAAWLSNLPARANPQVHATRQSDLESRVETIELKLDRIIRALEATGTMVEV